MIVLVIFWFGVDESAKLFLIAAAPPPHRWWSRADARSRQRRSRLTLLRALICTSLACAQRSADRGRSKILARNLQAEGIILHFVQERQMDLPNTAFGDPRALLRQMFDAAVAAAQPARCLGGHPPSPLQGPHHRDWRWQGLSRDGAGL